MMLKTMFGFAVTLIATQSLAANQPCSRGKGGVSHCQGSQFVCNDGSVSQSKRMCSADDAPAKTAKKTKVSKPKKDKP
jgi:hypothetical protein